MITLPFLPMYLSLLSIWMLLMLHNDHDWSLGLEYCGISLYLLVPSRLSFLASCVVGSRVFDD